MLELIAASPLLIALILMQTTSRKWLPFIVTVLAVFNSGGTTADAPVNSEDSTSDSTEQVVYQLEAELIGMVYDAAPDVPPGVNDLEPSLKDIRRAMEEGDNEAALWMASTLSSQKKWGRDREVALMVVGLIHRDNGRYNLASEAMTKVRTSKGPLKHLGAWFEAEQDLMRGKPAVAIKECEQYIEEYPNTLFFDNCERLIPIAYAHLGYSRRAKELATAYDQEHNDPISETVALELAKWAMNNDPDLALKRATRLALEHKTATIGLFAEGALEQLGATIPDDHSSSILRMASLRDSGRRDESMALFQELSASTTDDDLLLKAMIDRTTSLTGWRNRDWVTLKSWYETKYAEKPNGKDAWSLYKVMFRSGDYHSAAEWASKAMVQHGNTRNWRRKEEEIARTMMLSGDYHTAQKLLDKVVDRGGWRRHQAAFVAAYCTYRSGDLEEAQERFTQLIEHEKSHIEASRYWRAKVLAQLDDAVAATADHQWLLNEAPNSWYAIMVNSMSVETTGEAAVVHSGRWAWPKDGPNSSDAQTSWLTLALMKQPVEADWGQLQWPLQPPTQAATSTPSPQLPLQRTTDAPPFVYSDGEWFNEEIATKRVESLLKKHGKAWPELVTAFELSRGGLYELSGQVMSKTWDEYKLARKKSGHVRHNAAVKLNQQRDELKLLLLLTRDHHNVAATFTGAAEAANEANEIALARELKQLAYPIPQRNLIWRVSKQHDVDPYLVTSVMRRESLYDPLALSRVGARGAMQIMPRTGGLLAIISNKKEFEPTHLENPSVAVEFGVTYLGLLLDRFNGNLPMAVASYNGGPHNASAWSKALGQGVSIDEYVEHIPYRETRIYVKAVSQFYSEYLELYSDDHARVALMNSAPAEIPEVVDF